MSRFKFIAGFALLCGLTSVSQAQTYVIERVSGKVAITAGGQVVQPAAGVKFSAPAEITTSAEGRLRIASDSAALNVAPNSSVVIPVAASTWLERVQHRLGQVLFSVKPRAPDSFHVETPYLVAVVKGTTFSVVVSEHAAEVALIEGAVQLSAPEDDDVVLLKPNQRAVREAGASDFTVTQAPPAAAPAEPIGRVTHEAPTLASERSDVIQGDLNDVVADFAARNVAPVPPEPIDQPGAPPAAPSPEPPVSAESPGSSPPPTSPDLPPAPEPPPPIPAPEPEPEPDPTPIPGDGGDDNDNDNDGDGDDDNDDDDDDDDDDQGEDDDD